jgi:GAF domain-containing protein/anti-sigma regulatory factor (Ser/Thr protein kinase)
MRNGEAGRYADRRQLEALQRVTDAALASLSEEQLLRELLQRITEILHCDTAAILLLDDTGTLLHARAAKGIEEEVEQGVKIPVGKGFAGRVAAQRRAVFIEDVDHADVLNPILREKGICSLLGVPLLVEGRVLGVLHVGSLTRRIFTTDERDLLQLAADRAALAIEHAILFRREQEARAAAEKASWQLEALQRVTDAALASLSEEQLLRELLQRITEILHCDTAAILLLDDTGAMLHARAAKGIEEEVEQGVKIPVGKGFAGRVAAQRRAVFIEDVDHADIYNPILRQKGICSLLGVPLLVEGRVLGVLHVGSLTRRIFTTDERDLLQLAADRAALAIEHAILSRQRQLAESLQRRLLPTDLSGAAGLELASRYIPASHGSLGGDWYDAFPLADGRLALAIGDVVGHGMTAAAVMAQLRTALRAYAMERHPPSIVVERVNRLMCELGPRSMTTLAYVVLDPDEESVGVVSAGHLPPLVISADGAASYLPIQGGIPLAVSAAARYETEVFDFPLGGTILLYTDGLVETRRASIDDGLEHLRRLAAGADDVEQLCADIVERQVPAENADDIALVAARVAPLPDRLTGRWPTDRQALADIRRLLRRWLEARGAGDEEIYDITVACQEACANAVEHAYRPGHHSFELDARCEDGRVRVTVRDAGSWRPSRGRHRGRGVGMMQALMDAVDIQHSDAGTVVVLERALKARVP